MGLEGGQRTAHHHPTSATVLGEAVVKLVERGPVHSSVHGWQPPQFGVTGQRVEGDVASGQGRVGAGVRVGQGGHRNGTLGEQR